MTVAQEKKRIQQLINLDNQTDSKSNQYTAECLGFIQSHLLVFYEQYADDTGLSLSQVNQRVSRWDMAQWKRAIGQMGDVSDWPEDAKQRMSITGFIAGIDRSHLLDAIISLGIIKMTVLNQKNITYRVELDGKAEAKRMGDFFSLTSKQSKKIASIITEPETAKIWSRNLWIDADKMAGDVQYLVNQHLKHDMSLNDLNDILASHANPKQFKPTQSAADRIRQMEFNARRIVRTESARLKDEVNMTTYRMKGVKKVDWVCEPGACLKCQGIEELGPYSVNGAPGIPDDSHPNCRCSKIPHVDRMLPPVVGVLAAANQVAKSGAVSGDDGYGQPLFPEEEKAMNLYTEFVNRKRGPQLDRVAQNTGFSQEYIGQVYDHMFIDDQLFENGKVGRFDPDYNMAQSWSNLTRKDGKKISHADLVMLNHELYESILMKAEKLPYEKAHNETNKLYNYGEELRKEGRLHD